MSSVFGNERKGDTVDINTICLIIIGIAVLGGIINRVVTKKGIGLRFCQFLAISMGIPTIIMLAFADKLEKEVVASLIGTIIGFFVSRTGKDEDKN